MPLSGVAPLYEGLVSGLLSSCPALISLIIKFFCWMLDLFVGCLD